MGFSYTANDLEKMLRSDPFHGSKWAFALDKMKPLSHTIVLKDMTLSNWDCSNGQIQVDSRAENAALAKQWVENGMREWAGQGLQKNNNYFGIIARSFAADGPGKGNTAKSIGTTVDWTFLFSAHAAVQKTLDMYSAKDEGPPGSNLPSLICWVYANRWAAVSVGETTEAKVNIAGTPGGGPPGLHQTFWDSTPGAATMINRITSLDIFGLARSSEQAK